MESAGGDGVGVGVDCAVGTIVWVRRRNGSWWPGRILGSDELSASHLMSPRSGTPVKLLGREDASVDWYNLEKSKRVKAFRCGEFDACIERAEASQGAPIKKREKYARREDAILHALELEKNQFQAQQLKLSSTAFFTRNETSGSHKSDPANFDSPEPYDWHDEHGSYRNLSSLRPQKIMTKTDFSQEEENLIDSYVNKRSVSKQLRWQDDNSEGIPRMRGLQDFGLRTVQSKRKSSQIVNCQNFTKPLDNHVEMLSDNTLEDAVHASSSKNSLTVKRKRSQGRMVDESIIKKRDRRRPLVHVLESSAKLAPHLLQCSSNAVGISLPCEKEHMLATCRSKRSKCVYFSHNSDDHPDCDEHDSEHLSLLENQLGPSRCLVSPVDVVKEYVSSGLLEANDSSEADYLEHDMGEVANILTDTEHVLVPGSKDCEPPEFQAPDEFRVSNDNVIPNSGLISHFDGHAIDLHEHITDAPAEVGVSKWHMKGKRNTRNIGKRPMYAVDGKIYSSENCNGSMEIERAELSNQSALRWGMHPNKESFYACDEGDLIDNDLARDQLNAYCDWRNVVPSQSKDDGRRSHSSDNDSDNNSNEQTFSMAHSVDWEEPIQHFDPVYELEPLLVDIDIKVEATYQGEHVPIVSLMSRLNGKAIVGHPIQIELLESGSSALPVSKFDLAADETAAPPPVWRTARRTAMQRVPRLNPPTTTEDEDPDMLQHSTHPPLSKNSDPRSRPSRSRKFLKKNSKRSSLSSQKTRTLSSLVTSYKLDGGSGGVELATDDTLEGLISPEGSAPPVACVPVKVVFSRLLEAVGKPSSAIALRVRANSPAAIGDPT